METRPSRPNSYLALAIISTILCCLPTGIVSIIYSTKVNRLYEEGHYEEAERASKNAKTWGIVSIIGAFLGWLVSVVFLGAAFFAAVQNGGF